MSDQCGWAGKILRVNLTEGTFSSVDTMKYVPKYVGGMGVAHRIWWEEMRPGVKAFDPENKLIFTTGVTTGSAAPSGGRGEFVSISPYSYPEQYTNSSIGGAFPTQLKWLGYDGIILEGKAPEPSYLLITDKGPELKSAVDLWGMGLVDAQKVLFDRHGEGTVSYGIGPAGENLVRFAIIGCGIHSATGQGGMGAVMGSKNLKAITLTKGKHQVRMADPEALLQVTKDIFPEKANHPWIEEDMADKEHNPFWWSWVGPNEKPNFSINWMGNMYNKPYAYLSHSCGLGCLHGCGFYELRNVPATTHPGLLHAMTGCNHTRYEQFFHKEEGDKWAKGFEIHELAEQLGFGHFEIVYGIVPWLYYTKAVGIDTESLVGMPTDVRSVEWWTRLLNMIAYRQGFGDQLAEGLRRTVEELGAEKYADTMYEGPEAARGLDHPSGKEVKLPVAVLHGWGYTARSLGTEMPFPMNLPSTLNWMIDTRDPHHNKWPDWAHKEFGAFVMKAMTRQEDPYSAEFPLRWAKLSTIRGTLIDCLPVCFMFPLRNYMGWKFGDREVGEGTWTTAVESRIFSAVTGIQTSEADLFKAGERVNTLFRAIQIRDHERTAQMEFDEIMPRTYGTYDAEKFKVTTGNFYEYMGWDRETGWPTREHLEALDLKDVADELEALGKLPKMASVAA